MNPAFRKLDNEEILPIGYQHVNYHMIFDVKMEDLRFMAWLVAGGHVTDPPATISYVIVVSRETVRMIFDTDHPELFPSEGGGHSKRLHHAAYHREDMDSPGP